MLGRYKRLVFGTLLCGSVFSGCLLNLDSTPGFGIIQSVVATAEALPDFARAFGGTASATVSGQIVGRLPCDEVTGEVKQSGNTLRVNITLRADRQSCNGVAPTTFSYVANLLNVSAGNRQVVVEHRFVGVEGVDGVRLDTVVVVG